MSTTEWSEHNAQAQGTAQYLELLAPQKPQQRIDRVGFPKAACSSSSIAVGIIGSEIIDEFLDHLCGSTARSAQRVSAVA